MSRAFVRETDAPVQEPLDRPISHHPNLVTRSGLAQIDERLHQLEGAQRHAQRSGDETDLAAIERELRYWRQRHASAQVLETPAQPSVVRFGVEVTLRLPDGTEQRFRLVGEDEADPAAGLLSWTSPLARTLLGRRIGEEVELRAQPARITALSE